MRDILSIKNQVEALIFAWAEPISITALSNFFEYSIDDMKEVLNTLKFEYETRGIRFQINGDLVSMSTNPKYGESIKRFGMNVLKKNITEANMETLSVIAYMGPTTKSVIEKVRGVKSDVSIQNLLERGLIKEIGRLKIPGRPIVYNVTDIFLKTFELESIEELPPLMDREEIKEKLQFTEINMEDIEYFNDEYEDTKEEKVIDITEESNIDLKNIETSKEKNMGEKSNESNENK